ncbi:helix-turn-helix domain-containing protein [Sinorhizobium medicae]
MAKVLAFIENNLHRQIKLFELACECRLSVSHFGRAFKETFGSSPYQFVLRKRMERARMLLLEDGYSLSQIALECGMCDQSHFTRAFRGTFGKSPGAFLRADPGDSAS